MSATNSTPTINLPLFIGTDKPAWLTDWNGSMNAIDSAIATLQTAEGGTATALASLSQSVTALSGTVEQHTTAIQTVTTATATNTGSINTITSLIGNGEPTTEDKTIIGAINEIYAEIGGGTGVAADDVTYSNTSSGLTATDVQAAIDEVYAAIPSSGNVEADDVSYDNTQSGLTATDVQAAIDELAAGAGSGQYVEVTADGVKTNKQLLDALFALVDSTKLSAKTLFVRINNTGQYTPMTPYAVASTLIAATMTVIDNNNKISVTRYVCNADSSVTTKVEGTAESEQSSTVPTSGYKFRIVY